jgi:hypothetical protein
MPANAATALRSDELPCVDTWMNYAGDIKGRARVDVGDWSQTNLVLDKRDVRIYDARPIRNELSLDRQGFTLVDHHASVDYSAEDLAPIADVYLAEVAAKLKALSGADLVVAQGTGLLKRHAERANIKGAIGPSRWAHMDYTEYAAHKWVEWIEGWQNMKLRHYPHFVIYQTWRCVSPPPQDNTLVLCDASTIPAKNLIVFDACMRKPYDAPGNQFESQLCKYDPGLRWYYFPNMTPDELIVFKSFDSNRERDAQPLHNSADIPGLPANCVPRASIEARFFAFWT